MSPVEENVDEEKQRQEDVDRLYKKLSVEKHEKLKREMRDLITRFRLRGQKYEDKVRSSLFLKKIANEFIITLNKLPTLVRKIELIFVIFLFIRLQSHQVQQQRNLMI